jgi:hypothetical protein
LLQQYLLESKQFVEEVAQALAEKRYICIPMLCEDIICIYHKFKYDCTTLVRPEQAFPPDLVIGIGFNC